MATPRGLRKSYIIKHRHYIAQTVNLEDIADGMIAIDIIKQEQYEELMKKNEKESERMEGFFEIILNDIACFPLTQFCVALDKAGHSHIVRVLEGTDNPRNIAEYRAKYRADYRRKHPNERDSDFIGKVTQKLKTSNDDTKKQESEKSLEKQTSDEYQGHEKKRDAMPVMTMEHLTHAVSTLQTQMKDKDKEMTELRTDFEKKIILLSDDLARAQIESAELSKQISRLKKKLKHEKSYRETIENELSIKQRQCTELQTRICRLEEKISELTETNRELQNENKGKNRELRSKTKDIEQQRKVNDASSAEIKRLKIELKQQEKSSPPSCTFHDGKEGLKTKDKN